MSLPSTHWSILDAVRDQPTPAHREVLNRLAERYRYPAYVHLRWKKIGHEDAQDLVQEFFESCLQNEIFGRADRKRGRFRNFFLTALDNHVSNARRREGAQRRRPEGGFVPIDDEVPAEHEGVDREFFRAFASETVTRLLREVESECAANDQTVHFQVFRRRVVEPVLDGAEPPSEAALAEQLGVKEKQIANYLVTVKRIFRRRLRAWVADYAANEADVEAEIHDLMGYFRWPE